MLCLLKTMQNRWQFPISHVMICLKLCHARVFSTKLLFYGILRYAITFMKRQKIIITFFELWLSCRITTPNQFQCYMVFLELSFIQIMNLHSMICLKLCHARVFSTKPLFYGILCYHIHEETKEYQSLYLNYKYRITNQFLMLNMGLKSHSFLAIRATRALLFLCCLP